LRVQGAFDFEGPIEVIAHRGYSARAPENTRIAMEMAIEAGADALEFDVRTIADGTPVLFHDATLKRTGGGSGPIRDQSIENLAIESLAIENLDSLDAGSWFGPAFAGEPVPTLASVLEGVRGRVGRVYAEIKGYHSLEDVDRIAGLVDRAGMQASTVFISMDWAALDRIRAGWADALLGYIVDKAHRIDEGIARATVDPRALLDFDARLLMADPGRAVRARAASIELAAWTVNRVRDAARLVEMGVPRITTNEVETLVTWKTTL
jgi:glycerophosphoryl diester phosphodiesterase